MISIIAAVGKNGELGKAGQLIFHIKDDMKFFRETTEGHIVVMGRKTWESLPGRLKNRQNFVVSSGQVEGADLVIRDIDEFIKKFQTSSEEVFIIGGGKLYEAFLPYANVIYLTEIDGADLQADTFFPVFNKDAYNKEIVRKGVQDDLAYSIVKYSKR